MNTLAADVKNLPLPSKPSGANLKNFTSLLKNTPQNGSKCKVSRLKRFYKAKTFSRNEAELTVH